MVNRSASPFWKVLSLWNEINHKGKRREANPIPIPYVKLDPEAIEPSHSQEGDAGADYFALEETRIPARGRAKVRTGIAIAIPAGYYGKFESRSGLSLNQGIEVGAGIIDSRYRGELGIVLYNHTDVDVVIPRGKACAQLIIHRYERQSYSEIDKLPATNRTSGWGSSGR